MRWAHKVRGGGPVGMSYGVRKQTESRGLVRWVDGVVVLSCFFLSSFLYFPETSWGHGALAYGCMYLPR